jgi:hypothetical protein
MSSIPHATRRARALTLVALAAGLVPVVSQAQTAMSFHPLTPCRLFDTRSTQPPKVPGNTTREFAVREVCGVPASAQAAVVNITVTACTDLGNIRVYPTGGAVPLSSWLNFLGDGVAIANGGVVPLGDHLGNHVAVRVDMPAGSAGQCHLLADVMGYFEPDAAGSVR